MISFLQRRVPDSPRPLPVDGRGGRGRVQFGLRESGSVSWRAGRAGSPPLLPSVRPMVLLARPPPSLVHRAPHPVLPNRPPPAVCPSVSPSVRASGVLSARLTSSSRRAPS